MGVHARQGFNIQPHPATGHLGRVDITRRPPLTPPEGENSDIAEEKAINTYYPLFSLTINRRNYSSREVCKLPPFGGGRGERLPSFTVQSYEITHPSHSEFDMLQREKCCHYCFNSKEFVSSQYENL